MDFLVNPGNTIVGDVTVPGDKSISHRGLIFGALAEGETRIEGMLDGADCKATAQVLSQLGVNIDWQNKSVVVEGVGLHGLTGSTSSFDFGNSGTSIRLFSGLLSAQDFESSLTGDESLCKRPMTRVSKPLTQMGADIETTDGAPPLHIRPASELRGIDYEMPIASAQVKSALLLAGLYAAGSTRVHEPGVTRDHSERMLRRMGANVNSRPGVVEIVRTDRLSGSDFLVPGDFSSAAFPMVAALTSKAGHVVLRNVGVNPTRTGLLSALEQMGGKISLQNLRESAGEPVADIQVWGSKLRGIELDPRLVPLMIDEFPILFVASALAEGVSQFSGLAELRTKESDRIASMEAGLRALGVSCRSTEDSVTIEGGRPTGGRVDSFSDHRIAMAFSVLANSCTDGVTIVDTKNVGTSFPEFLPLMSELALAIEKADE
ncbi:MAG: 3-phosphoshikimate 1-carboxyvinyltransferase [Pseudomonadota bacterium]